jgi:hypothetical protein
MGEFDENVVVPTSVPQVHEYDLPEGDYAEKAQTSEYELDAAIVSMQLLRKQFGRQHRELERSMADLDERLKEVT